MHWVLFNSKFLGSVRKLNVCSRGGSPQDMHPKIAKHRLYLYRLHLIFIRYSCDSQEPCSSPLAGCPISRASPRVLIEIGSWDSPPGKEIATEPASTERNHHGKQSERQSSQQSRAVGVGQPKAEEPEGENRPQGWTACPSFHRWRLTQGDSQ